MLQLALYAILFIFVVAVLYAFMRKVGVPDVVRYLFYAVIAVIVIVAAFRIIPHIA